MTRPGELGYLDSFVPDAGAAYQRFRTARIAVRGDGPVVPILLEVLTAAGATSVTASDAGVPDLVVNVSDGASALDVDRACRGRRIPVVHGVRRGDELWVGVSSPETGESWESGWRRLGATPAAGVPAAVSPTAGASWDGGAAGLAASILGLAAFRELTGCREPNTMVRARPGALTATRHRFLPHFAARTGNGSEELLATVARLAAGPPSELDVLGKELVDERLGVIRSVSERDFVQLPLNVSAAELGGPRRLVIGAGLSVEEARRGAVLGAVARHAVTTPDPARLVPSEDGGLVRAAHLGPAAGRTRLVNATEVFAPPHGVAPGAVAGSDWASVVLAGLLECCAHRTALMARRRAVLPLLDVKDLEPDAEARTYLAMLATIGVRPSVHDVTGPLRAPTLALGSRGRTITYVSAPTASAALTVGLRAVVLDEQARRSGQPEYAPPPVPQLPVLPPVAGTPPPDCDPATVIEAFAARKLDVLVVPLDHDRELHAVVPYVVRVLGVDS